MTPELQTAALDIEAQLRVVIAGAEHDKWTKDNATEYSHKISSLRKYLESKAHAAVLIGAKGSGKSAMLSSLTGLTVGEKPTQGRYISRWAVLPTGPGGTTICSIRIRTVNDVDCPNREGAEHGLTLEPLDVDETHLQIDLFAEAIWAQHRGERTVVDDEAGETLDAEKERFIRGMTGCVRTPDEDPAKILALAARDKNDLSATLRQSAQLHDRTRTEWWAQGTRDECMAFLKKTLSDLNSGRDPRAPYPRMITVWTPRIHNLGGSFDIEYTDSKGFDGKLESQADLQELLKNDRCVYLLCTRFQDPPGEVFRAFLKTVNRIDGLAQASDRIRILIMDHGNAVEVLGANENRGFGQRIRVDDCLTNLGVHNLGHFGGPDGSRVRAFDTLEDDLAGMRRFIEEAIEQQRAAKTAALQDAVGAAVEVLANLQTQEKAVMQEVDRLLLAAFESERPRLDRLEDVMAGVSDLLREHPARVRAMCRRDGEFDDMNAYAAIEISVQEWFQRHFHDLDTAMQATFRSLERDPRFQHVAKHVRERRTSYMDRKTATGQRVAAMIGREMRSRMPRDGVWSRATSEWRGGPGFRNRVAGHIESFESRFQETNPTLFRFTPADFGIPTPPTPA